MGLTDSITTEADPRVAEMRERLDEYYKTTTTYPDFQEVARKDQFWTPIAAEVRRLAGPTHKVRVLEFGAGRTGFAAFLGGLRDRVEFTAQDVTPANRAVLEAAADHVHIGPVQQVRGPFDLIFSTFTWEHVSDPRATLEHLLSQLRPGGSIFIACPRYDTPIYPPRSARHYGLVKQYLIAAWLYGQRLLTRAGGRPRFFIHVDPAILKRDWTRDADAVHWVSRHDFARGAPGCAVRHLSFPVQGLRARLWRDLLLAFVQITKPAA
jgi:SAM-dependent methyltransferase